MDNIAPSSSIEVAVLEESTFGSDKKIGSVNLSLQELQQVGTLDSRINMVIFGSAATVEVHCVFVFKSSQPGQYYVPQQPALASTPLASNPPPPDYNPALPAQVKVDTPAISAQTSMLSVTSAISPDTELLGKLEIQVVNGKDIRKSGGALKFLKKDAFFVRMFITNNNQTGKSVKTRENEDGGTNPIWNDKLILKVFKRDVHLTVEICQQKDTVIGTGMVSLEKLLEPERAQSMWYDRSH